MLGRAKKNPAGKRGEWLQETSTICMGYNKSLFKTVKQEQAECSTGNCHKHGLSALPDGDSLDSIIRRCRYRAASHFRVEPRTVKIMPGPEWEMRFLPPHDGHPYFPRRAQHWFDKFRPVVCPRYTGAKYGSGAESCSVCDVLDDLRDCSQSAILQGLIGKAGARTQCFTSVRVLRWVDEHREIIDEEYSTSPWIFWLSGATLVDLRTAFEAGLSDSTPRSVMDFKTGCNFLANRAGAQNAVRLTPLPTSPIYPLDKEYDLRLDQILSRVKTPHFFASSNEELHAFAERIRKHVNFTAELDDPGNEMEELE